MDKNISPSTPLPIINIGLKRDAIDFLVENVEQIPDILCPKCNEIVSTKQNIVEIKSSDYGITLCNYKLKDGKIAETIHQPLDFVGDGAVIFLCLSIEGKLYFEWSNEEIQDALPKG